MERLRLRKHKELPRPAEEISGKTQTQISDSQTCALNYHALLTPWQVFEPLFGLHFLPCKVGIMCSWHASRVQIRELISFQTHSSCLSPSLWAVVRHCCLPCYLSRWGRQGPSAPECQGFSEEAALDVWSVSPCVSHGRWERQPSPAPGNNGAHSEGCRVPSQRY